MLRFLGQSTQEGALQTWPVDRPPPDDYFGTPEIKSQYLYGLTGGIQFFASVIVLTEDVADYKTVKRPQIDWNDQIDLEAAIRDLMFIYNYFRAGIFDYLVFSIQDAARGFQDVATAMGEINALVAPYAAAGQPLPASKTQLLEEYSKDWQLVFKSAAKRYDNIAKNTQKALDAFQYISTELAYLNGKLGEAYETEIDELRTEIANIKKQKSTVEQWIGGFWGSVTAIGDSANNALRGFITDIEEGIEDIQDNAGEFFDKYKSQMLWSVAGIGAALFGAYWLYKKIF